MAFNGIQHTWMQFFSAIEAGSNTSWNAKELTTVSIQLVLHSASIALGIPLNNALIQQKLDI